MPMEPRSSGPLSASPGRREEVEDLDLLERRLLDEFQHHFPLSSAPFAQVAERLGVGEREVIDTLRSLQERGYISRIGPVFRARRVGASTLAAMAVPRGRLEAVARYVNAFDEVNHNYERDHRFNLWFVVTAPDPARLRQVLEQIEEHTGLSVMSLPLQRAFHIDLGFPLWS